MSEAVSRWFCRCVVALVLLGGAPGVQAQEPIAWEVVSDSLQVRSLTLSGDSAVHFVGTDGAWVWRRADESFTRFNRAGAYTGILMASTGRLFFLDSSVRMSTDYGAMTPLAVHEGKAILEMPTGTLVVVGDGGHVNRSTDAGDTWTATPIPVFDTVLGRGLAFAPPTPELPFGRLVTVGLGGAAVSDDGGLTWEETNLAQFFGYDAESVVYSAALGAFFTAMNGAVEDGGSQFGAIRKSVDGRVWETVGRLPADERGFVSKLAAGANGSLWAVMGGLDNVPQGEVWRSVDGGVTWQSVGAFDGEALVGNRLIVRDVVIGPEGRVWVGFSQGVGGPFKKGLLVRTVEAVAASGAAGEPATPSEALVLGTPYPNPGTGAVTVPLTLAQATTVRVAVVDLLGREVAVLHDGLLVAGTQTLTFETVGLPAGVYVVRARVGAVTETRRVTVAR